MNLAVKESDSFPLPASLFMRLDGEPWATWCWLAKNQQDKVMSIIEKQKEYRSRLMTFFCFHAGDPKCQVNPFYGNPNADEIMRRVNAMKNPGFDPVEVDRWLSIVKSIAAPGNYIVPTIYCGDDRATTRNKGFVDWFTPQVIVAMYPYVAGYNLISEASKSWSSSDIDYVVDLCNRTFDNAGLPRKPILVHQQGTNIGTKEVILMYEFSKNPWNADQFSLADVVNELRSVLRAFPGQVWPQELAVDCEADWARKMSWTIRDMAKTEPRIVALPGPV